MHASAPGGTNVLSAIVQVTPSSDIVQAMFRSWVVNDVRPAPDAVVVGVCPGADAEAVGAGSTSDPVSA